MLFGGGVDNHTDGSEKIVVSSDGKKNQSLSNETSNKTEKL